MTCIWKIPYKIQLLDFNRFSVSIYYVPGPLLGAGESALDMASKYPAVNGELMFLHGGRIITKGWKWKWRCLWAQTSELTYTYIPLHKTN